MLGVVIGATIALLLFTSGAAANELVDRRMIEVKVSKWFNAMEFQQLEQMVNAR